MSLIRWSPMFDSFDEFNQLMNRFPLMAQEGNKKGFIPAMDIYEEKDAIKIEMPLAGMSPNDVEVRLEKNVLTVSGERKKEHEIDEKNYYRKEVRSGSFCRQVTLPAAVNEDDIKAEFCDGVLKITCPKSGPGEAKKINIEIKK